MATNRLSSARGVAKQVVLYGAGAGLLIAGLRLVEYRFLLIERSVEIYGALVALLFAAVGIRLGRSLTSRGAPAPAAAHPSAPPASGVVPNPAEAAALGITARELEILQHIAAGKSTREIAAALFVSENTVKTHTSRLFEKLMVKRRTQAVHEGRRRGLIP